MVRIPFPFALFLAVFVDGWESFGWERANVMGFTRRSYKDALVAGVFTAKPDEYFDVNVCANYFANLNSTTSS